MDLPQPDGPTTATYSPAAMPSDTSRSAVTGAAAIGKRTRHMARFDDRRLGHPTTSRRSVAAIGRVATIRIG